MTVSDKELETLLRSRYVEPPRAGFAERIIATAGYAQPSPVSGSAAWLEAFFAQFILPRPAFALASVLALGVVIGLAAVPVATGSEENMSIQSYLENDGAVL